MKIRGNNRVRFLIAAGIAGLALISSAGIAPLGPSGSAAPAPSGCVIGGMPAANNNDPLVKLLQAFTQLAAVVERQR